MEEVSTGLIVASIGFVLGMVFGGTAHKTNFCTMGAISDIVFMGDWNRFRAWMLATGIAILGSQTLHQTDMIDLTKSIYLTTSFGWFGAILGGLMFGFGMTLGSGCGNKTLVRFGAGNLKSLVVLLFLGISAYMTLRGLIGLARVEMETLTLVDLTASGLSTQGIPEVLSLLTTLPLEVMNIFTTIAIGGGLVLFALKSTEFRSSMRDVIAGTIIGLLVVIAWYVTGVIGNDDFEPVQVTSFTFIAPVGESLQFLMTFTGSSINFGISTVGGVIFGSFVTAFLSKEFRLEAFYDAGDMVRHIMGGILMGVGGVLALGCTVGQGITGMSTLAIGSLLALVPIIIGGVYGMMYLERKL
jgi:uncharacterized membrane protein YedE/YeeE